MVFLGRKSIHYSVVLIMLFGLSSCVSKRNSYFLRDFDSPIDADRVQHADKDYIVKRNDNLYISVKTINPEVNAMFTPSDGGTSGMASNMYSTEVGQHILGYQVDNNGDITLPVIGAVNVAGRTLKQVKEQIQKRADEYLKGADIQVRLLNFRISILGEVNRPGVYYNYNNTLTVLEAIGMAGGATDYAQLKEVLVVRRGDAAVNPYQIDLTKKSTLASQAFYLQPNDVVFVRPQKQKNLKLNSEMYSILLSSITTMILIISYLRN